MKNHVKISENWRKITRDKSENSNNNKRQINSKQNEKK